MRAVLLVSVAARAAAGSAGHVSFGDSGFVAPASGAPVSAADVGAWAAALGAPEFASNLPATDLLAPPRRLARRPRGAPRGPFAATGPSLVLRGVFEARARGGPRAGRGLERVRGGNAARAGRGATAA